MPMDLRFSIPAVAVVTLCAGLVVIRVVLAPAPTVPRAATATERAEIAKEIAIDEKDWRRQVQENFPRDIWSQSDDFHGREYRAALKLARERGVRVEDALRAVDEDIHELKTSDPGAPDPRGARAVPCKPRPFYD